jgi:hypothetical protein
VTSLVTMPRIWRMTNGVPACCSHVATHAALKQIQNYVTACYTMLQLRTNNVFTRSISHKLNKWGQVAKKRKLNRAFIVLCFIATCSFRAHVTFCENWQITSKKDVSVKKNKWTHCVLVCDAALSTFQKESEDPPKAQCRLHGVNNPANG